MREKDIEKYLIRVVKSMEGKAYKFNSGIRGMPDRIVLSPFGRIAFVEVKAPGKKPRPLQEKRMEELRQLGHLVYVVDSPKSVMDFHTQFFMGEMP